MAKSRRVMQKHFSKTLLSFGIVASISLLVPPLLAKDDGPFLWDLNVEKKEGFVSFPLENDSPPPKTASLRRKPNENELIVQNEEESTKSVIKELHRSPEKVESTVKPLEIKQLSSEDDSETEKVPGITPETTPLIETSKAVIAPSAASIIIPTEKENPVFIPKKETIPSTVVTPKQTNVVSPKTPSANNPEATTIMQPSPTIVVQPPSSAPTNVVSPSANVIQPSPTIVVQPSPTNVVTPSANVVQPTPTNVVTPSANVVQPSPTIVVQPPSSAPTNVVTPSANVVQPSPTIVVQPPSSAPTNVVTPSANVVPVSSPSVQPTTTTTPNIDLQSTPTSVSNDVTAPVAPVVEPEEKQISINFTNVSAIEIVRFVSRISNRNFLFDEADLQFNITIVSEKPASVDTIMTAFFQELRIHGMNVIEINNTYIIHKNPDVKSMGKVEITAQPNEKAELITRLFSLNTLDPEKAANIVRPMLSTQALVEASKDTRHLIVTDLAANITQIDELLKGLDSPNSGLNIGQYVVKNTFIGTLVELTEKLMRPIVLDQHFVLVPHSAANSIFIVSTPFLVDRTISLLQRLDQIQGTTGTYGLEELKFQEKAKKAGLERKAGQWELDEHGNWVFRPLTTAEPGGELPKGKWLLDADGNWYFQTEDTKLLEGAISHEGITTKEAPKGYWRKDANGNWVFELGAGETINAQALTRVPQITPELPLGHIERTRFYIHKLRYRRGEQIVRALLRVGESLALSGISNEELVAAINSIQWIESSNVLVLTGTIDTIDKMRELINEIDIPLRQVFIEMLLLETTIDDSLTYGVQWSTHSGGGLTSTNQNFIEPGSTLPAGMSTTLNGGLPNANPLTPSQGFAAGIIGTVLSHNGTIFHSIGALVTAIHDNTKINILLNPKLLVEDNATAEIFVGINTQFQTQSIVNEFGSVLTNNFEFRDVGTRFKVTPIIGPDGLITMDVEEEVSDIAPITTGLASVAGAGSLGLANIQPGPTTRKSKSVTKVHVPNGYFMIFSGMIQDEFLHRRENVPCLGGLPLIGGLAAHKHNAHTKRNLIIFLRPIIVDTDEQIDNITKHQQDIFKIYRHNKSMWKYEVEEGLDYLNLINTDCENDCPDPA